ncbi:MAG: hypothetical protein HY917_01280, partial [Candidatus Diapherotrites archaeon]|nr:hypothetical protein [Candidatus Diapherotrites archaeon]
LLFVSLYLVSSVLVGVGRFLFPVVLNKSFFWPTRLRLFFFALFGVITYVLSGPFSAFFSDYSFPNVLFFVFRYIIYLALFFLPVMTSLGLKVLLEPWFGSDFLSSGSVLVFLMVVYFYFCSCLLAEGWNWLRKTKKPTGSPGLPEPAL